MQRTQNLTEQYRAKLLAEQAQQELVESQERMRFALESVPILVWTANPSGERDYFNTRCLQFTGRTLQEQLGGNWRTSLHPDDQIPFEQLFQHSVATGQAYHVEYRLLRIES